MIETKTTTKKTGPIVSHFIIILAIKCVIRNKIKTKLEKSANHFYHLKFKFNSEKKESVWVTMDKIKMT